MSKDILDDILGAEVEAPHNEVSKDDTKMVKEEPKKATQKKVEPKKTTTKKADTKKLEVDMSNESNPIPEEESTKEAVIKNGPVESVPNDDKVKNNEEDGVEAKEEEIANDVVKAEASDDTGKPKDIKFPKRMILNRSVTLYRAPNSSTAYTQVSGSIVVTGPNVGDYSPITGFISGGVGKISGYIFSPISGRMR